MNEKVQLLMELKKLQKALTANVVSVTVLKFCYKKDPGLSQIILCRDAALCGKLNI